MKAGLVGRWVRAAVACAAVCFSFTAVADISASAYVQDGLVVQYDGIDNAGTGTHDANARTWKDLKGQGGDMPLGGLTSPVWDGKGLSFSACGKYDSTVTTEFLCTPKVLNLGDTFTIQMFCNTGDKYDCRRWDLVPYSFNYETWTSSSEGFLERVNNANRFSLKPWVSNADIIFTTVAGDKKHRFMIEPIGGTAQSVVGNLPSCVVNNRLAFMKTNGSNVPRKDCYSIRVYNRALTADEIALNAAVDKIRFDPNVADFRWNAETEKVECRVIVETEGSGTFKIGDGEWTTAATNWVEFGSAPTYTISASPADVSAFVCWKIGTGESSTAQPLERTISGPTVIRAVFRDETAMKRWIYLPSAQSGGAGSAVISNAVSHTVLKVTLSGTSLTISGIFKNGDDLTDGAKTLDLSTPVESLDYVTQYAITTINGNCLATPFKNGAENLYLPETLTTFGGQMIDGGTTLRRVRFPANLTAINKCSGGTPGYQFRSCANLLEVLPAGILESGQIVDYSRADNMFNGCKSLTNCINFANVTKIPGAILLGCSSACGNPHIENVTSVGSQAFSGCGKLTFPDPLVLPNVTSIGNSAFSGTTISNLDVTGAAITAVGLDSMKYIKTLKPKLFPDTVTSVYMYQSALPGDFVLPAGVSSISQNAFLDCVNMTSIDLSQTSVTTFGQNAFWRCNSLTNFVFPRTFNLFRSAQPFLNETALTHMRFTGDLPTIDVGNAQFGGCAKMAFYVPYWNESWENVLAEKGEEMSASDVATYRTNHPGEPVPVQKLNLDGKSGAKPVARWFVDPPTETTRGLLSYFETLHADGVSASASPAQAFDGTTYALGAGDLMCTCAAGAEIVVAIPEAATLTRGLKLKAYRIHQMSAGEHPNGRAPTAWTLYGKQTDDGNWVEVDKVAMSAESANKWPFFGTDSDEIPVRSSAALTYQLSAGAEDCYVAFKFVPTASFLTSDGVGGENPIGFGEIELLGEMVGVDPVIGSFAVARPGWKSATFDVELISAGEKIAERRKAEWVRGTIELSKTSDFAEIAASSAATDLVAGGVVPITVAGLEVGATYYARVKVANDLGGVDEMALDGAVTALSAPFEVAGGMFPAPVKGEDGFTVSVDIAQLLVPGATVELYYAPDGVNYGATPLQTKAVVEPGTVTFDPFPSEDTLAFVKIRIVAEDAGVTYEKEYVRSVHEFWLGNAVAVTAISNTVKGIVLKCSLSGTNVTVSGITAYNDQTVFDLTLPVCDSVFKPLAITSVGSTFKDNLRMTELYLPDTITALGNQAIDQWDGDMSSGTRSQLVKLRLPNTLTSATYYNFRGMRQLKDCENLMPKALTTLGDGAFTYWVSITNDLHFYEAFRTFSNKTPFANGWANVKRVYFHGAPADPTAGVFSPMTTLTFFVPRFEAVWEKYLAESCETRALTVDDRAAFRTAYPGERMPKMMVKMPAGAAKWRYLQYWYPDPKKRPGLIILVK